MTQDEDPLAALDAKIAALEAKTREGLPARAEAVARAVAAWRDGLGSANDARRAAHRLRGMAQNPELRALAEAIEISAARDELPEPALVARLTTAASQAKTSHDVPAMPKAAAPPGEARARLLVVDDDRAILRMVCTTLERVGGHEVVSASNADAALAALDGDAFDVILLDAMMPDKNGLELCAEARARETQRDATLVVLSAANRSQLGWPTEGGPDHWWLKPLPASVLVQQVGELVDARRNPKRPGP